MRLKKNYSKILKSTQIIQIRYTLKNNLKLRMWKNTYSLENLLIKKTFEYD